MLERPRVSAHAAVGEEMRFSEWQLGDNGLQAFAFEGRTASYIPSPVKIDNAVCIPVIQMTDSFW